MEEKRRLPNGWRWVRLEEVCRVLGGSTPSSIAKDYWDGSLKLRFFQFFVSKDVEEAQD